MEGREVSVQDLVNFNFQVEELERNCGQCGASQARAQSKLAQLPRVFVLYLKRHNYYSAAGKCRTKVIIPPSLSFSHHVNLTVGLPPELAQEEFSQLSDKERVQSPSEIVNLPETKLCLKSLGSSSSGSVKRKWEECWREIGDSSLQPAAEEYERNNNNLDTMLCGSGWQARAQVSSEKYGFYI